MPYTPVASKAAVIGEGVVLSILGPTSGGTSTPTAIAEMTGLKFDGWKFATTTTTNFDSGNVVQKLGTLLDYGTLTGTYNNNPTNAGQAALLVAFKTGVPYNFTLDLPAVASWGQTTTGNSFAISGIITEAGGFDMDMTKPSTCPFALDINSVTLTLGS